MTVSIFDIAPSGAAMVIPLNAVLQDRFYVQTKANWDADLWLWLYRFESIVMRDLPYSMRMFKLEAM